MLGDLLNRLRSFFSREGEEPMNVVIPPAPRFLNPLPKLPKEEKPAVTEERVKHVKKGRPRRVPRPIGKSTLTAKEIADRMMGALVKNLNANVMKDTAESPSPDNMNTNTGDTHE